MICYSDVPADLTKIKLISTIFWIILCLSSNNSHLINRSMANEDYEYCWLNENNSHFSYLFLVSINST